MLSKCSLFWITLTCSTWKSDTKSHQEQMAGHHYLPQIIWTDHAQDTKHHRLITNHMRNWRDSWPNKTTTQTSQTPFTYYKICKFSSLVKLTLPASWGLLYLSQCFHPHVGGDLNTKLGVATHNRSKCVIDSCGHHKSQVGHSLPMQKKQQLTFQCQIDSPLGCLTHWPGSGQWSVEAMMMKLLCWKSPSCRILWTSGLV